MKFRDMMDMVVDSARSSASRLRIERYRTHLTVLVGAAFVIGCASVVHSWYVEKRERVASDALAQCIQLYESAQTNNQLWPQVEVACTAGYNDNRASYMAPLFLEYHINALLAQGKKSDALAMINKVSLPKNSPLYPGFAVKHCLLVLDSTPEELTQAGYVSTSDDAFAVLKNLAQDTRNTQRDMALYYAGLYAWSRNDLETAKNMWQQLCSVEGSPYAQLVQDRLQSLL